MNKGKRRSILPYIPGYDNNAVLKLIFFISGAYMLLAITWAIMMMVNINADAFNTYVQPNVALPHLAAFRERWWTLLTYGFFHFPNSFMELLSNMLWLYCFGSVMQMLVGKKEIAPLFVYSVLVGGASYLLVQLLPGEFRNTPALIMGPRAGMAALCVAAVTLSPGYRFYLSETFSIPIAVVAGIFGVLAIIGSGYYLPVIAMLLGGGLTGFAYVKLLKAGYRPGQWIYSLGGTFERMVTPNEAEIARRKSERYRAQQEAQNPQKRIDDLLDKINQKGYNSLTAEEKEFLKKVGKE